MSSTEPTISAAGQKEGLTPDVCHRSNLVNISRRVYARETHLFIECDGQILAFTGDDSEMVAVL